MERRGEERGEDRAGLVALGLIMELVGSVIAAYLIVKALEPLLNRLFLGAWDPQWGWEQQLTSPRVTRDGWEDLPFHVMLLTAIGILRALVHRRAGRAVLYRSGDSAGAIGVYVAVALGHTALCVLVFWRHQDHQSHAWAAAACVSLAWPIALLIATRRRVIRLALSTGRSATAASAPDQVATLMVFFGLVGCLVALFAFYTSVDGPLSWSEFSAWLPVSVTAFLCLRSVVHTRVGVRLAGDTGSRAPLDVSSYVKVGLITAALSWLAIVVLMYGLLDRAWSYYPTEVHLDPAWKGFTVYLLFLWPLLLRGMARARAEADQSTSKKPSSSGAGLLALGWLLLGAAAVQIGLAGLSLHLGPDRMTELSMWLLKAPIQDGPISRGVWMQLLVAVPQVWVALELLRASPRRRRAATLYAACASIATVVSIQADMELLMRAIGKGLSDATALVVFLPVAFWLLVPIATLVYVQQQLRREGASAPVDSSSGGGE